jgi:hypothetical protein
MAVHIEQMTSEVAVAAGDLPLTQPQIEQLIRMVMRRIDQRRMDAERIRAATCMRTGVAPDLKVG